MDLSLIKSLGDDLEAQLAAFRQRKGKGKGKGKARPFTITIIVPIKKDLSYLPPPNAVLGATLRDIPPSHWYWSAFVTKEVSSVPSSRGTNADG